MPFELSSHVHECLAALKHMYEKHIMTLTLTEAALTDLGLDEHPDRPVAVTASRLSQVACVNH